MNQSLFLVLTCVVAAVLGAVLGGAWAWRRFGMALDRQLPGQLRATIAPLLQAHLSQLRSLTASVPLAEAPSAEATLSMPHANEAMPQWAAEVMRAVRGASDAASRLEQTTREGLAAQREELRSQAGAQQRELRALRDRLPASQGERQQVPPRLAAEAADPAASATELAPMVYRLGSEISAQFDLQKQAQALARQHLDEALQQALKRVPQLLQQALQIELEFLAQQQTQRDQALMQRHERWQAEQAHLLALREERHAAELRAVMQAVAGSAVKPTQAAQSAGPERSVAAPPPRVPAPNPSPLTAAPPVSARPPELLSTPLPRPQPVYEQEADPVPELSDAELDALPAELPVAGKARPRVLPAPRKPVLHRL